MHISTDSGVSLVLRIDKTLPLREKADSEATVEAWTVSRSRVMAARTGYWDSIPCHQAKILKFSNSSCFKVEIKSVPIYLPSSLLGVFPRARLLFSFLKVLYKFSIGFLLVLPLLEPEAIDSCMFDLEPYLFK
ncbi:hypothetical protein HanRHA438_Chr13g0622661 [Helianthus annuus]|nr:hypothetical protein HanRHA438_Chr13g0622661 [Helianthus annuus]